MHKRNFVAMHLKRLAIHTIILVAITNLNYSQPTPTPSPKLNMTPIATLERLEIHGRLIGYYRHRTDGNIELLDTGNNLVGTYKVSNDTTYDKNWNTIGRGNLLGTLLGR